MQKLSCVVVAAWAVSLVFVPAGVALAQGAPSGGTAPATTSTTAPEAKAPENKAPENKAPENTARENTAAEKEKAAPKKKKAVRDDPAAGDRPFGRPRHRARALPELGAERVSSVYSVR
jgi:hypothetical protein